MEPWKVIDQASAPGGGELVLSRRGEEYAIRVGGRELMSSRAHGSEERMAEVACEPLRGKERARVLVGGLGLGYTARAALDRLSADAEVVVAELVPAVIAWNRGPLAALAARPLEDPRIRVEEGDVGALLRQTAAAAYDAILLDVDNGPSALTQPENRWLYGGQGLAAIRRTLRAAGSLVVWSASPDPVFARRLGEAGFRARTMEVPARGRGGGPRHTLFVASVEGARRAVVARRPRG